MMWSKQASARTNEQTSVWTLWAICCAMNWIHVCVRVSTHSWSNNCQNHFRSRVLAYTLHKITLTVKKFYFTAEKWKGNNSKEEDTHTLHKCNRIDSFQTNHIYFVLFFHFSSPVSHVNSKSKRFPRIFVSYKCI